jgi:hypothetical protein
VATFRINSIVPILIFFLLILATASSISQMLVKVETRAQGAAEFSQHRNFFTLSTHGEEFRNRNWLFAL